MNDLSVVLCKLGEFSTLCEKDGVTLCLATKTISKDYLVELSSVWDRNLIFAENKAQELRDKYFESDNIEWHFIGRLQENKLKYLIGRVSLIQSVDSVALIDKISEMACKKGIVVNILIEVNVGEDASKGGVPPSEYVKLARYASNKEGVCVKGLMSVLPHSANAYNLTKKACELVSQTLDIIPQPIISVGMSQDYSEALKGGSNMIRIGSSIFGKRS